MNRASKSYAVGSRVAQDDIRAVQASCDIFVISQYFRSAPLGRCSQSLQSEQLDSFLLHSQLRVVKVMLQ